MDRRTFSRLKESVRQAGEILHGKRKPARSRVIDPDSIDTRVIRMRLAMSQSEFAAMLGVSVDTVQNWDQGRRKPSGAAHSLLQVAREYPDIVAKAITGRMATKARRHEASATA